MMGPGPSSQGRQFRVHLGGRSCIDGCDISSQGRQFKVHLGGRSCIDGCDIVMGPRPWAQQSRPTI
eukprot:11364602-Karenia_brevis.AAC.1